MGMDKPQLKKCFKDEADALEVFKREVLLNKVELQKHGLFFSFTTDPMLPEFENLHWSAIMFCNEHKIPVKVLTKLAGWVEDYVYLLDHSNSDNSNREWRKLIAFGFTLTGHDELEKGASTNFERIEGMKLLHEAGFKTFASIEPVIEFWSSYEMMKETREFCDLFKVGLESGKKYKRQDVKYFIKELTENIDVSIYFKDSLLKQAGISRESLPVNCVTRKYNIFTGGDECLEKCESCEKEFDIEDMQSDSTGNYFCPDCWAEFAPVMAAEYQAAVKNGEI